MNIKLQATIGWLCALVATSASAAFQTHSEYQSAEPYGNSQTTCFRNAILGGGPSPLSAEEEARLISSLPIKETGHFYGRLGVNNASVELSGLKSSVNAPPNSTPPANTFYPAGALTTAKTRRNKTGLEMALGYFWSKNMRFDIEVLFNKTFNYSSFPMFTSPITSIGTPATATTINPNMTVELKNTAVTTNAYYEFMFGGYDRFHPFLVGTLGICSNRAKTTLTPTPPSPSGSTQTTKKTGLVLGGGIGFRFVVFSRTSIYASLRYISLGSVHMKPLSNYLIKGNYSTAPFTMGLIYLF